MVLISGTTLAILGGLALAAAITGGGFGLIFSGHDANRRDADAILATNLHHLHKTYELHSNLTSLISNTAKLSSSVDDIMRHIQLITTTILPPGFVETHINALPPVLKNIQKRSRAKKHRRVRRSSWSSVGTLKKPLTALEDDASVDLVYNNSTKYQTRILESGLIAPQLGLVMEQTGTYMEYSGYIYVPIIYHMPHLAPIGLVGKGISCNISANAGHQKIIIGLLKDKIGVLIPKQTSRRKRFIATVMLGGAVAWNRASIWSLQDTVSSLDQQLSNMRKHQQIVVESMNTLIDNQHAIYHAVDRQARILKEYMEKTSCDELITNYFREVYSTWLSLAPNDFSRVVDSALSGKITPDMLPAIDVVGTLLKHPAMVSTAYSHDMTLLYELGKFTLHQVNYDPYPMVSGVMIFPRILIDRSAALMRIYTTHSVTAGGFRRLLLPDTVACKSRGVCWPISPTTCKEMLTLTLCPKQNKPQYNACIKHLVSDNVPTDQCEWEMSSVTQLDVVPFDGGVLVSASNTSGEIMVSQGRELVVHRVVEPSSTPFVLTSADGEYLNLGGQIYQLTQETLRTGYEIVINVTVPSQRESIEGLSIEGWVTQDKIPQLKNTPWAPPYHYTWWILVGLAVLTLSITILVIKYRASLARLKTRVTSEISGWMTVPSAPPQYPVVTMKQRRPTDLVV